MAAHRDQLDTEFMERVKSVEEEKIMASQKLADSEHKMINMQKVSFIVFKLASKLLSYSNRISSWTDKEPDVRISVIRSFSLTLDRKLFLEINR